MIGELIENRFKPNATFVVLFCHQTLFAGFALQTALD